MKRFFSYLRIPTLIVFCVLAVSVYFLYIKFQLGLHRYFDVDEFAYLWWASHMQQGSMPYRDFFFFGTPGFLWLITPLFSFVSGISAFFAARYLMFFVYVFFLIAATALFYEMRKSWIAVFVPLFLLFLPLPSDKFLEIRPDTVAMTLFLFGLTCQIRGMNKPATYERRFFVSGVLYACALVVSQKMFVPISMALLGFVGWLICTEGIQKQWLKAGKTFAIGAASIVLITVIWLATIGDWPVIWYSLTKLPFEASKLGAMFPIAPSFFFFPNDVVYGTPGYHSGYWLNLLFWSLGIGIGALRLVAPLVTNGKKGVWQELILACTFFVSFAFFIWGTPLKHSQYLIPLAVFVCFYVADFVWMLWNAARTSMKKQWVFFLGSMCLFVCLVNGFRIVTTPKLSWTNDAVLITAQTIFTTIPKNEPILDLEGLTVYYPQPYYLSCLPIGQIAPLMSMSLPSLPKQLEKTDTKYIFQGGSKRLITLSGDDQAYINAHFVEVGDGALLVRNDVVSSYDKRISQ